MEYIEKYSIDIWDFTNAFFEAAQTNGLTNFRTSRLLMLAKRRDGKNLDNLDKHYE